MVYWWMTTLRAIVQHLREYSILIAWLIAIGYVFQSSYFTYKTDPRYFYVREILGNGLMISRAAAAVVNVSCFMVILPMCRFIMYYVRIFGSQVSAKFVVSWIDASRKFHVICAFTILTAGCIHSVAHIFNAQNFSARFNTEYREINVAEFKGEDPLNPVIKTIAGITGLLMILILCMLSSTAVKNVRNISYDLFWISHHLFLVFFILLMFHPIRGLIKDQVNLSSHSPGCQMNGTNLTNTDVSRKGGICAEVPVFVPDSSMTWKWIVSALAVYTIDLGFRLFRRRCNVELLSFEAYKCNIMRLKLAKDGFVARPGQYVFLQCRHISLFAWHPFSISECSSPDDPSFTIHFRTKGDWSEYLQHHLINERNKAVENGRKQDEEISICLTSSSLNYRLFMDGPYSSCFEDVLRYSVSICIAGGIGFTPFASILSYLRTDVKCLSRMKRLHLVWISREVEIFKCFYRLLSDVFELVWKANEPDKFEVNLYLTQKESWANIKDTLQDSYQFLKPRIQLGRPGWNVLFEHWANVYKKTDVGLFCCGPQLLNHDVRLLCHKWNNYGCQFFYHHESFS